MLITSQQLRRIIIEEMDDLYSGGEMLQETVSMWIDPDTDKKIDDRAESVDMPPGSLAAIYRKGLADWIEHNRYGKGKEQHLHALEDVEDFIYNRNDVRSHFPVEWNRVKNFRIRKKQKEYRKGIEKRRKAYAREQARKEKLRAAEK